MQIQMRDSKQTKSLILPSVGSKRREKEKGKDGPRPEPQAPEKPFVLSFRIVVNCSNTEHSLLKHLYPTAVNTVI